MEKITPQQLQKLHVLLNKLKIIDLKKDIIFEATNGRSNSSRELYKDEATSLLQSLSKSVPEERMIYAIKIVARMAGIIYGHTSADYRMNDAKIDAFLRERGVVKKPLKKMSLDELKQTHRQFEGILKNNKKTAANKTAKQATDKLLKELNISTEK